MNLGPVEQQEGEESKCALHDISDGDPEEDDDRNKDLCWQWLEGGPAGRSALPSATRIASAAGNTFALA